MFSETDLAATARVLAHPARAAMMLLLLDGRAHSASELAAAAAVSPPAATRHLGTLADARLAMVTAQGRRRMHVLASPEVADAIEALAAISPLLPVESLRQAHSGSRLRFARACYSHLGGGLAVRIARRLTADGVIDHLVAGKASRVRTLEHPLLLDLGIRAVAGTNGAAARGCLDWTEQAPHLAGRLGSALMTAMLDARWLNRVPGSRALALTRDGRARLARLGITDPVTPSPASSRGSPQVPVQ